MSDRAPVMERVKAPWTDVQVHSLNEYQHSRVMHPFTCGHCRDADERWPSPDEHLLVATHGGWTCPTCAYTQDWAWNWMTDNSWRALDWRRTNQ